MPTTKKNISPIVFAFAALTAVSVSAQTVANCPSATTNDPIVRSAPTIFHASDTIDENQTVQFFGDSMNSAKQQVTAMGWSIPDQTVSAPQTAPAFNASGGTCLPVEAASGSTAKVLLPGSSSHSGGFGPGLGLYTIQLGNSSGASSVWFFNRAEPWWVIGTINDSSGTIVPPVQGGTSDLLIPGQTFRVFGRNLYSSNQLQGWLQGNGLTCALPYNQNASNNWSASFVLPTSCALPAGTYTLSVHNGLGGAYGFGKTLTVSVGGIPAAWPTTTYNVKSAKYGAQGNGYTDDTNAFQLALADAKAGGIVQVPPGTYILSAKLTIPPYTILQGTGTSQNQTLLVSSENGSASVLAGNGNFNIQNLSIQTATARRVITCPDTAAMYNSFGLAPPYPSPACSNVLVSNVTINHSTPLAAFNGTDLGNGSIHTYGSDIKIQNSSITAVGTAPMLLYGAHHNVVSGNTLYNGDPDADGFFETDRSIYENNFHASTPGTSGNAVYVEGKGHYLYVAGNTIQNSVGSGGEGFVSGDQPYVPDIFGVPSAVYAGSNPASDPAAIAFVNNNWSTNQFAGEAVYVVSGKGALQRNYVAANNNNTLYLANLWSVPLDGSSVVDVVKDHSEGIFYNNIFSNVAVSVDLYSQSYGYVVDNNTSSDAGGTYCLGWNHTNISVAGPAISTGGAYNVTSEPGTAYGPVNLRYSDYSDPNGLPLIAQQFYGRTRNDVTGFVGLEFTAGGTAVSNTTNQISIFQLGRMCLAGNSGAHVVKLVAANGADVPGGSATVSMAGCTPGQYVLVNLPNVVTLSYATPYFLVSQETAGGDQWYDAAPVTVPSPFNLCYFNQWTNNHVSGSLDSGNPNKYLPSIEFVSNTAVVGPVIDAVNMNSPSGTNGFIPPIVGNEVRANTLSSVTQGSGAGQAIVGGVYDANQASYSCAPVAMPNGGATDTLVEANSISGAATPIWFWNLFGNTLIHNNAYQGTPADFSFTSCSPKALITTPAAGSAVAGSVLVSAIAQAQTPATVASVQFQVDGNNYGNPVTAPYQITFNSTQVVNGPHYLTAVALDSSGRTSASPIVSITVSNNGAVSTAPVISGVAAAGSGGSETISWTTDQPSDSQVFYGTTTAYGSSSTLNSAAVTTHSVVLSGLSAGTQYHYYVQSTNTAGLTSRSGDAVFTVGSSTVTGGTALITSYQAGTPRSNFAGYVGMEFTTGQTGITVSSLGRLYLSGNSGTHIVKLVQASSGTDVPGASVTISMNGGTGGAFTYGQLASPVALAANTAYYLVSQEVSGGDQWYDIVPVAASSGLVAINGPTYSTYSSYAVVGGMAGYSYVPVNLLYTTGASSTPPSSGTAFITATGSSTLRNNFTGWVGYELTVGSSALQVQALGRFFVGGSQNSHVLKLVQASSGVDVPGGSVTVSGGNAGQYTYASLASPVTLAAGISYYLVSQETAGGDQWYDLAPLISTSSATVVGPVYDALPQPYSLVAAGGSGYGPLNMLYGSGSTSTTNPPTVTITNPTNGTTVTGSSVSASATASAAAGLAIASVQFQIDGVNTGSSVTAAPYTTTFNSTTLSNSTHSLRAVATDTAGVSATSAAVSITVSNGGGSPSTGTALVTGFTPSTTRNNFTGWVGMQFTVGATPLSVSSLGRIYVSGNSGTHVVKLVQAGVDVPGGSAQVSLPSGTAGQFAYASLASPITLAANTTYDLVSQETSGGDAWYNLGTVVATSAVAVGGGVYSTNSGYVLVGGQPNASYVPVSLEYTPSSGTVTTPGSGTALLTGFNPGNVRNDYTGFVGLEFTTGSSGLTVTSLGRIYVSGNTGTHVVKLVQASNGADVAGGSVQVTLPSGTVGQFSYAALASPVTLSPNTNYYLVSQETYGDDQWYNIGGVVNAGAASAIPGPVYYTGYVYVVVPGLQNESYVPVNLLHN